MRLRGSATDSAARFQALRDGTSAPRRKLPAIKQPPPRRAPLPPRHERMPIGKEQIEQLRAAAEACGDRLFARVCERALRWDVEAINACKAALYGLA
jgi:hypothetical protein